MCVFTSKLAPLAPQTGCLRNNSLSFPGLQHSCRATKGRIKFWTHCPLGLLSGIWTRESRRAPQPSQDQHLELLDGERWLGQVFPTTPDISSHWWPEDQAPIFPVGLRGRSVPSCMDPLWLQLTLAPL